MIFLLHREYQGSGEGADVAGRGACSLLFLLHLDLQEILPSAFCLEISLFLLYSSVSYSSTLNKLLVLPWNFSSAVMCPDGLLC